MTYVTKRLAALLSTVGLIAAIATFGVPAMAQPGGLDQQQNIESAIPDFGGATTPHAGKYTGPRGGER